MNTFKPGKITLSASERVSLAWIKARSSTANGVCVEVASAVGNIAIRDSKDPNGPILVYTPSEFRAFLEGARNGEFDNLVRLPTARLATDGPSRR
jgi:hypothetical protein